MTLSFIIQGNHNYSEIKFANYKLDRYTQVKRIFKYTNSETPTLMFLWKLALRGHLNTDVRARGSNSQPLDPSSTP